MVLFKICICSLISVVLILLLKKQSPQISLILSILTGSLIFMSLLPYLKEVVGIFEDISKYTDIKSEYVLITFKIIGISYIAGFVSRLCEDAGESAIGQKVEFAGKILLIAVTSPVFLNIINTIVTTLS